MASAEEQIERGEAFAALVDWGTSNLRIWLVNATGDVLAEAQSAEGMGTIDRPEEFAAVLEKHLGELGAGPALPVVAAGMVGARTGWIEAHYLALPVSLADLAAGAVRAPHDKRDVFILPGACQKGALPFDVMRGEETQLAGALSSGCGDGLYCLPGTHSKWALIENSTLTRFSTVMTGELFDLFSKQSILRLSLKEAGKVSADHPAFLEAIDEALRPDFPLTARLFSIRAGSLLAGKDATEGAARLSGLLIGAEIAGMQALAPKTTPVRLIGSASLGTLYLSALERAGLKGEQLDGSALVRLGLMAAARKLFTAETKA